MKTGVMKRNNEEEGWMARIDKQHETAWSELRVTAEYQGRADRQAGLTQDVSKMSDKWCLGSFKLSTLRV